IHNRSNIQICRSRSPRPFALNCTSSESVSRRHPVGDLMTRAISDAQRASPAIQPASGVLLKASRQGDVLSLQSITGGEGSSFQNVNQKLALYLADRDYYFGMTLQDSRGISLTSDKKIRAGETYTLHVSVSLQPYVPLGIVQQDFPLKQYPAKIER